MNLQQAPSNISKEILVQDEFWGEYRAELLGIWENLCAPHENYRWKAKVRIVECTKEPSQLTLDGRNECYRKAYKFEEVRSFNIAQCYVERGL